MLSETIRCAIFKIISALTFFPTQILISYFLQVQAFF
nr:MAG TPA: hypothetical protein [Caudoviricetes sp.]